MFNFAYFNPKNTYINICKSMQIYKTTIITVQMIFLFFFFLSASYCSLICLLLTTKKEKCEWGRVGSGLFDIIKKLKKYYYLNKIDDRIDKLMLVICKSEGVK